MIIQLRYHVVSLVAVFLALGLGIIIGVNFGKTVSLELEREIQSLEDTYAQIRADQKILQAALTQKENELNIAQQFHRAILPNLTVNRLVGKRIAIIRTNSEVDFKYAKQMVNLLRQAGAEVASVTSFLQPFDVSDDTIKKELVAAFGLTMVDPKLLVNELAEKIAQLICNGKGSAQMNLLQNKNLVQLWGDYSCGTVDTIVFLGGGSGDEGLIDMEKNLDQPLLDGFRKLNKTLVGVEPSFVKKSYMRLYQTKCQGTVDNVETPPGEATLVYLLLSGKKGHYGVKDTARAFVPTFTINY